VQGFKREGDKYYYYASSSLEVTMQIIHQEFQLIEEEKDLEQFIKYWELFPLSASQYYHNSNSESYRLGVANLDKYKEELYKLEIEFYEKWT